MSARKASSTRTKTSLKDAPSARRWGARRPHSAAPARSAPAAKATSWQKGRFRSHACPSALANFDWATTTRMDVRRCPDADANCLGLSECPGTTSGCAGGRRQGLDTCRPGLTGTYCRACVEPAHFYVAGAGRRPLKRVVRHCKSCHNQTSLLLDQSPSCWSHFAPRLP